MAYTFDTKLQRYRDSQGRVVPDSRLRALVEDLIAQGEREMGALAQSYMDGDLTHDAWLQQSRTLIRQYAVAAAALARGGLARMGPSDWGTVGALVREQYDYFQRFADQVAAALQGEADLVERDVVKRAALYPSSAWRAQSDMEARVARERGRTEERWVLTSSGRGTKSTCPDCRRYAAMGWQPIGTFPAIGETECIFNCRCHKAYR